MSKRTPLFDSQVSVIDAYFDEGLVHVKLLRKDRSADELVEFKLTHQAAVNLRKKIREADEVITKGPDRRKSR